MKWVFLGVETRQSFSCKTLYFTDTTNSAILTCLNSILPLKLKDTSVLIHAYQAFHVFHARCAGNIIQVMCNWSAAGQKICCM